MVRSRKETWSVALSSYLTRGSRIKTGDMAGFNHQTSETNIEIPTRTPACTTNRHNHWLFFANLLAA